MHRLGDVAAGVGKPAGQPAVRGNVRGESGRATVGAGVLDAAPDGSGVGGRPVADVARPRVPTPHRTARRPDRAAGHADGGHVHRGGDGGRTVLHDGVQGSLLHRERHRLGCARYRPHRRALRLLNELRDQRRVRSGLPLRLARLGTWAVRAITVASAWRTVHNPNLDVAFLATAPLGGKHVQAITGGLDLGLNSAYGQAIQVIGYNDSDDLPVRCPTRSFEFRPGQLEFYCHDYHRGTSGSPWITGLNPRTGTGVVRGVIGGYEQGGYYEWASYSAYFGAQVSALFKAAAGLQDLGAVHLAERVGEQFKPGAVGVLEVDRGPALRRGIPPPRRRACPSGNPTYPGAPRSRCG